MFCFLVADNNKTTREFGPLVVAFVGLPARGKTVLAHKLSRYLRLSNIPTEGRPN